MCELIKRIIFSEKVENVLILITFVLTLWEFIIKRFKPIIISGKRVESPPKSNIVKVNNKEHHIDITWKINFIVYNRSFQNKRFAIKEGEEAEFISDKINMRLFISLSQRPYYFLRARGWKYGSCKVEMYTKIELPCSKHKEGDYPKGKIKIILSEIIITPNNMIEFIKNYPIIFKIN